MIYFPDIEPIAFDIETTGLDARKDSMFAYCLGDYDMNVSVHRVDDSSAGINKLRLERFFQDTSKAKVCHNMHFEMNFMSRLLSIPEDTVWHDTMLMSQVLKNNTPSHALDYLAYHLADYPLEQDKEVTRLFKLYRSYQRIPKEFMHPYQVSDGERTMLLYRFFWPLIQKEGLEEDYWTEIEMVKSTVRMEKVGLRLHEKNCNLVIEKLKDDINNIQIKLYDKFGRFINLNSDKQLSNMLYREMGYKPLQFSEKTGEPTTDKDALAEFRERYPDEEVFDWILQQRSSIKGIATVKKYLTYSIDGIIYPNIGTNEAKSGRQTSKNPPLQNVSKNASIKNPYHIPLRQCFRCHRDSLLWLVDYQGIELRLIADAADDDIMLGILKSGGDVHQEAMECFRGRSHVLRMKEKDPDLFSATRSTDKNAHFALAYGASMLKVATTSGLEPKAFTKMFAGYKERHPKIVGLLTEKLREVKANGYVETPFKRKLYVNRQEAYAGLNYLIQGTAAGILKRAQIRVDKMLRKKYNDDIKIVLPVHDELIIHAPRAYLKYKRQVMQDVSNIMCDMPEINVNLETEWKSTRTTWDQVKKEDL